MCAYVSTMWVMYSVWAYMILAMMYVSVILCHDNNSDYHECSKINTQIIYNIYSYHLGIHTLLQLVYIDC